MALTCVIYCRISKDPEGNEWGVERQEAACRELAGRLDLRVDRVFVDNDISASTLSRKRRPAYEEMMALVEAGQVGTILAYSNSRLTRRPLELHRLIEAYQKTGVTFQTVASGRADLSTADGRAVAITISARDAAEAERTSERVKAQKTQAVEMGKYLGGWRPYGFEADGRTVRDAEAEVIKEIAADLVEGTSLAALVRRLNARGEPTSTGGTWTSRTLCRVVTRAHPSVDADVTAAVGALLADPDRRTSPGPARRWLLSGLATCDVCSGPLRGSGSSRGVGQGTYPAYRCPTGKHVVVNAVTLDMYVSAVVVARLSRPDAARLFVSPKVDTAPLWTRAKVLRTRLDSLADDLDIDERTLARRSKALNAELESVNQQIAEAARSSPLGRFAGRDPQAVWDGLDLDQRRAILDIVLTVVVTRSTRGVVPREHRWQEDLPAFDPRRVVIDWR